MGAYLEGETLVECGILSCTKLEVGTAQSWPDKVVLS
jgi:hypothetical protein